MLAQQLLSIDSHHLLSGMDCNFLICLGASCPSIFPSVSETLSCSLPDICTIQTYQHSMELNAVVNLSPCNDGDGPPGNAMWAYLQSEQTHVPNCPNHSIGFERCGLVVIPSRTEAWSVITALSVLKLPDSRGICSTWCLSVFLTNMYHS